MEQQEDAGVSVAVLREQLEEALGRRTEAAEAEAVEAEVEPLLPCSEEVRSTAGRRRVLEQEEEEETTEALDAFATEGEPAAAAAAATAAAAAATAAAAVFCREAGLLLSTARGREEVEEQMEE